MTDILEEQRSKSNGNLFYLSSRAAKETGRPPLSILMEFLRLSFAQGRLSKNEYFEDLCLYASVRKFEDLKGFVGTKAMRIIWSKMNFVEHWHGVINHKLFFNNLIRSIGVPTVQHFALYSKEIHVADGQALRDEDEITNFLATTSGFPMFAKPLDGTKGLGAACCVQRDKQTGQLFDVNGARIDPACISKEIVSKYPKGYIFQELLTPHKSSADLLGERLATVRVYTVNYNSSPKVVSAVWKLPSANNIVDNWACPGNMLADLDLENGSVRRVVGGYGADQREYTKHPQTGRELIGARVPQWERLIDVILNASNAFPQLCLLGWDIAPTNRGPAILEANEQPDLMLPQVASSQGFLTRDFMKSINSCVRNKRNDDRRRWAHYLGARLPGLLTRDG